jgi:large repetitive protein
MKLNNASNIHFNNKSASKVYLNNNFIWSSGIVADNLLLEYDSTNYSNGTTMTDSSGNARNGTIGGSPSHDGDYFTFSTDYITTPDLDSVITADAESHTTEVWVYPTNNGVVVQYNGQPTPNTAYHFSSIEIVGGNLEVGLWNGSLPVVSTGNIGAVSFNQWHQIVLTFDGSIVRGYLDGVYKGQVGLSWLSPMDGSETAFHMNFGYQDETNQGDGTHFDGKFGIMRVYNKKLTNDEVNQNWLSTKSSFGL